MGTDKKLLLEKLPSKLDGIIRPDTSSTVIELWKTFHEIYIMMQKRNPSESDLANYFAKANSWVTLFTSLGPIRQGYNNARVTPYMHSMVYHVPRFMRSHKGIRKFSGQGVEKKNDDCRGIHLQKSNKWDAAKDVLLASKRLENSSHLERTPREHRKRNATYWDEELKLKRAQKKTALAEERQLIAEVSMAAAKPHQTDVENMSTADIKTRLKEMGIITRIRNPQKLQKMYCSAMQAQS